MIVAATKVDSPAAGPETAKFDLLIEPATIPPIIPDNKPAYKGAPDAKAIPKHNGKATKKTEIPAAKSWRRNIIL